MTQRRSREVGSDFDWSWTEDAANWVPPVVDSSRPSVARIYDYFLGGKDNFAADRQAGQEILRAIPDAREMARSNRAFLVRAVRCMAEQFGIRQFIDLGTGIPTSPNVHEVARAVHADARVVYVDHDPVVLAHNRALLATEPTIVCVQRDLREPFSILADPAVPPVIDFGQPVGLLFVAVLHFVSYQLAPEVLAQYHSEVPSGSCIAISAACGDGTDPTTLRQAEAVYARSTSPVYFRTTAQIEQLFDGYDLTDPGLADLTQWRNPDGRPGSARGLAGVGRKP